MKLKFKKLNEKAKIPVYATAKAAGMDLHACLDEAVVLQHLESALVPTGLAMELPEGYQAEIRGRSGLASKNAVMAFNGVLDQDFRGELMVLLTNYGRVPFTIEPDMRIAQMVVNAAVVRCRPEFVDELDVTDRGEGGFGSTGVGEIPGFSDSAIKFAVTEIAYNDPLYQGPQRYDWYSETYTTEMGDETKVPDHVRYTPEMGNNPPTVKETMAVLLKASKGEK